jgi:hypothetical protein
MMFVYPINLLTILRSPVNLTHCIIVGQNAQNAYLFIVNVILFEQIIDVLIDWVANLHIRSDSDFFIDLFGQHFVKNDQGRVDIHQIFKVNGGVVQFD